MSTTLETFCTAYKSNNPTSQAVVLGIGDSTKGGFPGWKTVQGARTNGGLAGGDPRCDVCNMIQGYSGQQLTAINYGVDGAVTAYCSTLLANIIGTVKPAFVTLQVGVNDLAGGHDWAYVQSYFDAMLTSCKNATPVAKLIVGDVWPSATYGGHSATLAFNAAKLAWVNAQTAGSVYNVASHDIMADPGNNANLLPAWLAPNDNTHPNRFGVDAAARLIWLPILYQLCGDTYKTRIPVHA